MLMEFGCICTRLRLSDNVDLKQGFSLTERHTKSMNDGLRKYHPETKQKRFGLPYVSQRASIYKGNAMNP